MRAGILTVYRVTDIMALVNSKRPRIFVGDTDTASNILVPFAFPRQCELVFDHRDALLHASERPQRVGRGMFDVIQQTINRRGSDMNAGVR